MKKTLKECLIDEGLIDDGVFIPEALEKGFVGIAETDWYYGRPIYDLSKLNDVEIPETPEGMKEPIFFTPGFNENEVEDVIVFDPQDELNKAIVGITDQNQAVYEYDKLLEAMMEAEGWDEEEAADWISYNTLRDYSYRERGPIVYNGTLMEYIFDNYGDGIS